MDPRKRNKFLYDYAIRFIYFPYDTAFLFVNLLYNQTICQ